ncbi:MAG: electron transport complex subunit RsxC [Candidatus Glassbacteria bacterium]|nr:electron transport complex subunit RsxC [Candidatus Glassbacteria bacterium]
MLKQATFPGGVHPPDSKEATRDKQIETLQLPSRVILPLQQHIGAPLECVVAKGDEVSLGDIVARATGFVSVPLHATLSGTVKDVGSYMHPAGLAMEAVVIESDGEDTWADGVLCERDWRGLDSDELKKLIREAGIVGLGGAAFPTHVKLSPPADKTIDTFLVNGAECEPFLNADYRQMMERAGELIEGIKILIKILGCERTLVAVEDNKPAALEKLDSLLAGEQDIAVAPLRTKYPQGGEKQLVEALTGRHVPSGGLPMDVGCLIQNVSTILSVFDAVTKGRPLLDKVVTVAGASGNPGNYLVRIGTPVEEVLTQVEGEIPENLGKVIMGGPLMGLALPGLDVPVLKGTNGLVLMEHPVPVPVHEPCIRCGRCVDTCPVRLVPCELALFAENERWDKCREYHVMDCIECGSCSYTCPAGRNLVQLIRFGKYTVMSEDKQKKDKK